MFIPRKPGKYFKKDWRLIFRHLQLQAEISLTMSFSFPAFSHDKWLFDYDSLINYLVGWCLKHAESTSLKWWFHVGLVPKCSAATFDNNNDKHKLRPKATNPTQTHNHDMLAMSCHQYPCCANCHPKLWGQLTMIQQSGVWRRRPPRWHVQWGFCSQWGAHRNSDSNIGKDMAPHWDISTDTDDKYCDTQTKSIA